MLWRCRATGAAVTARIGIRSCSQLNGHPAAASIMLAGDSRQAVRRPHPPDGFGFNVAGAASDRRKPAISASA